MYDLRIGQVPPGEVRSARSRLTSFVTSLAVNSAVPTTRIVTLAFESAIGGSESVRATVEKRYFLGRTREGGTF